MAPTASVTGLQQTPWYGLTSDPRRLELASSPPVLRIHLHDIRRQTNSESLPTQIVAGLKEEQKSLPSLLLWNGRGLKLFDAILDSGKYYPAKREPELLASCMPKIAHKISSGERVIELGAGNMRKTALLLRNLEMQQKHVEYYALDVSRSSLRSSIRELLGLFPWNQKTKIQGLLGTYEDCISWLHSQSDQKSPVTLLWLGNSIANFTPDEATELLAQFFGAGQSSTAPIQMIAGIDGCQNDSEIVASYESDRSRNFILNGLDCANGLLGRDAFVVNDWDFCGQWNVSQWAHESYCVPRRDLDLEIEGEKLHIKNGEKIRVIRSGKWPYAKVVDICAGAHIGIAETWSNSDGSYGVYLMRQSSK